MNFGASHNARRRDDSHDVLSSVDGHLHIPRCNRKRQYSYHVPHKQIKGQEHSATQQAQLRAKEQGLADDSEEEARVHGVPNMCI